jgi:hypothetical protein
MSWIGLLCNLNGAFIMKGRQKFVVITHLSQKLAGVLSQTRWQSANAGGCLFEIHWRTRKSEPTLGRVIMLLPEAAPDKLWVIDQLI